MIESPDSHEIDALESLVISDGWRVVSERVTDMLERARCELEQQRDPVKAAEARGVAATCRIFLELPAILQQEIQAQLKEK